LPTPLHKDRIDDPDAKRPKHTRKDFDSLIRAAWDQGWSVTKTGKNYLLCKHPTNGSFVKVPSTPSSNRTLMNKRSEFKRGGLTLPDSVS